MNKSLCVIALVLSLAWMPGAAAQDVPPSVDVSALVREANRIQLVMSGRINSYTWNDTQSFRKVTKSGKIKAEPMRVYESFPNRVSTRRIMKRLVSENGVPLPPERVAKETERLTKELERDEREAEKQRLRREKLNPSAADSSESRAATSCITSGYLARYFSDGGKPIEFSISHFLCAGEFYNPRRVSLRGRDMILLDFRPRADFVPDSFATAPYAKLVGRIWIDAGDKAVSRLEAHPESMTGGDENSPVESRAKAFVIFEQMRLPDGTWLHSMTHLNTTGDPKLFNNVNIEHKEVWSNHQRFNSEAESYKVVAPKSQ